MIFSSLIWIKFTRWKWFLNVLILEKYSILYLWTLAASTSNKIYPDSHMSNPCFKNNSIASYTKFKKFNFHIIGQVSIYINIVESIFYRWDMRYYQVQI